MTSLAWCRAAGVTHGHCPCGCAHSQPIWQDPDGVLLCGACWVRDGDQCVMVPCTPETCGEEKAQDP
jgi:hypothetical protein